MGGGFQRHGSAQLIENVKIADFGSIDTAWEFSDTV
jgi:hypothetical protein